MKNNPDLAAAERELAEAFADMDDACLGNCHTVQGIDLEQLIAMLRFAATYELARRERERKETQTNAGET